MNYAYLLRCADGSLYAGWTNNLEERLAAHNTGKAGAKYTHSRRPVELVYFEGYASQHEAMHREVMLKRMTRQQKLALIEEYT